MIEKILLGKFQTYDVIGDVKQMIIRESENEFIMITQHDHAQLSGEIARNIRKHFFVDTSNIEEVLLAVYQHDRSWIKLDDTPIWNDSNSVPFSFIDYPILPKIVLYKYGIDQVEEMSKYAALLCSLHYTSFQVFHNTKNYDCINFLTDELKRQNRIKSELNHIGQETISAHLRLLQFCDDISLYACFNNPGVNKVDEHPWYKSGFKNSEFFDKENGHMINAFWNNQKEIKLTPSPFEKDFSTKLKLKHVSKMHIKDFGIAEAYRNTTWTEQEFIFVSCT